MSHVDKVRFACCGGAIPPPASVGDAGLGDQRLAAGRGRGGGGLSLNFRGDGCLLCEGVELMVRERALRNWYEGKV